ncbi:MAG: WecB/TagA/CpsF family glycosyltransferase [Acidobacteriota bacterium]
MGPVSSTPDEPSNGGLLVRLFDLALALLALIVVIPAGLVALLLGARWRRTRALGERGRILLLSCFWMPAGRTGRVLERLAATSWPRLYDVVIGNLQLIGPEPGLPGEPPPSERPGLVGPWWFERNAAAASAPAGPERERRRPRRPLSDLKMIAAALFVRLVFGTARAASGETIHVQGLRIDNLDMDTTLQRLGEHAEKGDGSRNVVFINAHCANVAAHDASYRGACDAAEWVFADGSGMKIGARLAGEVLADNVNGTDLFPELCTELSQRGCSIYLLGARPEVVQGVVEYVEREHPGLVIAGHRDGYFTDEEEGQVVAGIAESGADVLLVAMGVPRQELWLHEHLPATGAKLGLAVGGLFDFYSGRLPRAPLFLRDLGLEWTYRLLQEPGRLWRRYLIGNVSFLWRSLRTDWRRTTR